MRDEIISNLAKYDKDERQLSYEEDIVKILKNKHSLIKYVHPDIIIKYSNEIMEILGDSSRYLKYLPKVVINANQKKIYEYSKYNHKLLEFLNRRTQQKYITEVILMVRQYPLNYDFLDESIKQTNKELFRLSFNNLFKVRDGYLVDTYYKISLENDKLLHNMNKVMLNKELVMALGDSVKRIVDYPEIINSIERLSSNKQHFKIFLELLKLYTKDGYIERVVNSLIKLVSKEYYFYKKDGNVFKYNKDLFSALYKDSLSINEIKKLYYILSNDLIHINSREEFFHFSELRNDYLTRMNDESLREIKNIIYEYNYAMNYKEINYLIGKYSSCVDYLISKYKKFRFNIDEVEEYETLLVFKEMIKINNCDDYNVLNDLKEDAYINQKEIRSYDIRINIEEKIKKIYHKEYERVINRKANYINEEKVLYEELVSNNKLYGEYNGKNVVIKTISTSDFFSFLVRKNIDNKKYYNIYENISNEFINVDINDYYFRTSSIGDKIVNIQMDVYDLPGKKYNKMVIEDEKIVSVICFGSKPSGDAIRKAIDLDVPLEILNKKDVVKSIDELKNSIFNKIIHYLDNSVSKEEDERIAKYSPIDCIGLFFNISNNMVLSNNLSKDMFTKNIKDILRRIDSIKDNYTLVRQIIIVLKKALEIIDNTFDKKVIYRDLDRIYRKYDIYIREEFDFRDPLLLLESNKANDIRLFKKYNSNQIEYGDVVNSISFDKIIEYLEILENNYYHGNIERIIRISLLSNILINLIDMELSNLCLLASIFSDIGRLTDVRFGDYSASIFRSIFKNTLNKEDLDIVCAAIDSQDSVEELEQLKNKYKLKNIEKFIKVSSVLKDAIYLDNYKVKKGLINKEATRLIKVKDIIKNSLFNYDIELLIRRNIISKRYYDSLLNKGYDYEEIVEICEKL